MNTVLIIALIGINIFFPIISLLPNLILFIISNKYRKFFGFLLAFSLACIAYTWEPSNVMDLYRWHIEVRKFSYMNFNDLITHIQLNFEPINYFIKYAVSKTGDINLLQFIVSLIGYYEMFWMLSDCAIKKKVSFFSFLTVFIFVLISLQYISFISGLWFNFAIINFSVGIYLEQQKNTKHFHWIFYILSICIHISTIFLLGITIASKLTKTKIKFSKLCIVFAFFLFIGNVLSFLNTHINFEIIKYIYHLYVAYFLKGDQFGYLHNGITLYLAIARLIACLAIIIIYKNKNLKTEYYNLLIISCISIIAVLINAGVFTRYAFYMQLITFPLILDYINEKKLTKNKLAVIVGIILVSFVMTYPQIVSIKKSGIINNIHDNLTKSTFNLRNGG